MRCAVDVHCKSMPWSYPFEKTILKCQRQKYTLEDESNNGYSCPNVENVDLFLTSHRILVLKDKDCIEIPLNFVKTVTKDGDSWYSPYKPAVVIEMRKDMQNDYPPFVKDYFKSINEKFKLSAPRY